jgi:hypothetical protein
MFDMSATAWAVTIIFVLTFVGLVSTVAWHWR